MPTRNNQRSLHGNHSKVGQVQISQSKERMKPKKLSLSLLLNLSLLIAAWGQTPTQQEPSRSFHVAGEVGRPGEFIWRAGLTFRQAIALAEGVKAQTAGRHTRIFRKQAAGQRAEIEVDLLAVMCGERPDLSIEADDFIVVPNPNRRNRHN